MQTHADRATTTAARRARRGRASLAAIATNAAPATPGRRGVAVERMEPRVLWAADPVISEFLADNDRGLADADGQFSDWIEIRNPNPAALDLGGWHLTDDAADPDKWTFPAPTTIAPFGHLVVFASDKNRAAAGQQLHTNFKLSAEGDYLALTKPDNAVAHAYAPAYPPQQENVSYGLPTPPGEPATLLATPADVRFTVPTSGALGTSWTLPGFDDAAWTPGSTAIGYEPGDGPPVVGNEVEPNNDLATATVAVSNFGPYAGPGAGSYQLDLAGQLSSTTDTDHFKVGTLRPGNQLTVTVAGAAAGRGALANPRVELYRRVGSTNVVAASDDDSGPGADALLHRFEVTTEGTYYVRVNSPTGATGTYQLGLVLENIAVAPDTGSTRTAETESNGTTALANDVSASWRRRAYAARVSANAQQADGHDVDVYQFELDAGDLVTFSTERPSVNMTLALLDAAGAVLALDDGSAARPVPAHYAATVGPVRVPATGTYYVRAAAAAAPTSGSNNTYRLDAYLAADAAPPVAAHYADLIATHVPRQMIGPGSTAAYARLPFTWDALDTADGLSLAVRVDDGFVAYLNGVEVARYNAPGTPGTPLPHDAAAPTDRVTAFVRDAPLTFDLTASRHLLVGGTNVLALHALSSDDDDDADLLLEPELTAVVRGPQAPPAYLASPTPGAGNSAVGSNSGPVVTDVSQPAAQPGDADDIVVTARVAERFAPVASATLVYRVNAAAEVAVPMADDGLHGDGAAGDGVYGATIPASAAGPGQLVRWAVTAADAAGRTSRAPLAVNAKSAQYLGTVVRDLALVSTLPIVQIFDTGAARAGVFFGGEYYDNVALTPRGAATTDGIKLDFDKDHRFRFDAEHERVDEVNLNYLHVRDRTNIRPILSFDLFRDAGEPAPHAAAWRVQRNGAFWEEATFIEEPDEEFFKAHGLDPDGALYKLTSDHYQMTNAGAFSKKTRQGESNADLQAFLDELNGPDPVRFLRDHFDVMGFLNYWAANQIVNDNDDARKNYFLYRDTDGDGRWRYLAWDKDLTFGQHYGLPEYATGSPISHPLFGDANHPKIDGPAALLTRVLLADPQIKQMYLRRLRSLMDQFLQPASTPVAQRYFETKIDAYYDLISGDPAALADLGGASQLRAELDAIKERYLAPRRQHLFVDHSTDTSYHDFAGIPAAQVASPVVTIGAYDVTPADGDQGAEYVRLDNPAGTPVDISGWSLADAVEFTFAGGTVIPANGSIYVAADIPFFRARTTGPAGGQGLFVVGGYDGQLSARGETIALRSAAGTTVHSVAYAADPTPAQQGLRVTEIMYHPPDAAGNVPPDDAFEFVELHNVSPSQTLNLAGVRFTQGVELTLPAGASLAPGAYGVVVGNRAAFQARYGTAVPILGEWDGTEHVLDNGGERLRVEDAAGEVVLDFNFDDAWHPTTDGAGRSLVIVDPLAAVGTWGDAGAWRASTNLNGSPGAADPGPTATPPAVASVTVNDGHAQRSRVTSVTVTFDRAVSLAGATPAAAFQLSRTTGGAVAAVAAEVLNATTVRLTFAGPGTTAGSLDDGVYALRVLAADVRAGSPAGPAMAADYVAAFHRLFSDGDGDGDSDAADLSRFRQSLNKRTGDAGFLPHFDYDANGVVDASDLGETRGRRSVVYLPAPT